MGDFCSMLSYGARMHNFDKRLKLFLCIPVYVSFNLVLINSTERSTIPEYPILKILMKMAVLRGLTPQNVVSVSVYRFVLFSVSLLIDSTDCRTC